MLTGEDLGRAIEVARKKKNVSKVEMATYFEVKPPSVSGWVTNGRIAKDKLPKLFEYFSDVVDATHWGLDPDSDLYALAKESKPTKLPVPTTSISVPVYDVAASAGKGLLMDREQITSRFTVDKGWFHQVTGITPHDKLAIISVEGDSMSPTFNDGDMIIVDTQDTSPADAVYCLRDSFDHLKIKRLQWLSNGNVKIASDNKLYESEECNRDQITLIGRVRYGWRGTKL